MKPSEICEQAAELIEERGWARYEFQSFDGRLCAYGAVRTAVCGDVTSPITRDSSYGTACEAIASLVPGNHIVTYWNDCIAKNKDEVIELLRLAAKDLSNENQ